MASTAAKASVSARGKTVTKASSAKSASADNPVNGSAKAAGPAPFSREEDLIAYREMLMIRRFEEKAGQLYGMGLIGGFCHLYIGQEAVVVGMQMATKPGDQVITGYRDHGHMLACGMDANGIMAELTGRRGGFSRGNRHPNLSRVASAFSECGLGIAWNGR